MQNFSEKKCTFLSSKIILGTPSGRPGKPIRTQGGTAPKIWSKLGKFSSKKSRIFLENFHIFYYPLFVKIHVLQQISMRKNTEKQLTFFDTFFPKFAHFCARCSPGKSPIFDRGIPGKPVRTLENIWSFFEVIFPQILHIFSSPSFSDFQKKCENLLLKIR